MIDLTSEQKATDIALEHVLLPSVESLLTACFISIFLGGLNLTQMIKYFSSSHFDALWLKLMVTVLASLNTLDTIFVLMTLDQWLVLSNGHIESVDTFGWAFSLHAALLAAVAFIVQGFYAWRVYVLSRRSLCSPACIVLLALGGVVAGVLSFALTHSKISGLVGASHDEAAIEIFKQLLRLSLETNLLTFVIAFAAGVLFMSAPAYVYLPLPFVMGRTYELTVLYSVNSRIKTARPCTLADDAELEPPLEPEPSKDYIQLHPRLADHVRERLAQEGFDSRNVDAHEAATVGQAYGY
ncbi:uncharacterized protein L969DRAFT_103708 [Mixia osmundae IAM 14324]|uniref:Uncharacterized protein n=1 Tax=Mixia osmundae (strain CBS 9802 / IAM 14324 / JCM 22182 / KY 12970) TaxID=764103 RepID=G7E231_MIXOS|nr:uncharacterized protein L969DRAFT_103708 [Mixia osmundae IAM 14324]KEI38674.1 hypothetical protein L969DRAFT_103708 [Mixia osmundae IAM 14324]GAA96868.1 hypothetical protein E5Q_03541 [Mixia osmundae IAM 14324]